MKGKLAGLSMLALLALMLSGVALAHHGSAASYDLTKQVTATGVVTSFVWANPHVFIMYNVTDDKGNVVQWGAETHAPVVCERDDNWGPDTFKPGDKVTVTVFPSKIGSPRGLLAKITLNGKVMLDDGASRRRPTE